MTSRQAGRRISTLVSQQQSIGRKKRSGTRQAFRASAPSPQERWKLLQLVICGGFFVLLVTVKLLLPSKIDAFNEKLSAALQQNMDVQAVFSAVGRAISGDETVNGTLDEVYEAVFHPQQDSEALETAAVLPADALASRQSGAMDSLRSFRLKKSASSQTPDAPEEAQATEANVSTLAYVLYSDRNLPKNVSMEQAILGFSYCTPVVGTLSSGFGYREHPLVGEERFHYGVDLAADSGAAVDCFADGTVTTTGESSSYGKYVIVAHSGGYATLYAHCSRITASSGESVEEGEKIAEVGETGMATGPHLHFEIHCNDTYLNPIYYVEPT